MKDKQIHNHPLGAGFAHKDTKVLHIHTGNDKCVSCNAYTPYAEDSHIDTRNWYVEGAGQLCKECWERIYEEKETKE